MKKARIWSEERQEWVDEIFDDVWCYQVDREQFQLCISNEGVKLYQNGYPQIADKWYKKITVNSTEFTRRPVGERTCEVINQNGRKGLYIYRNYSSHKPELIVPEDFNMIRTTSKGIGVRNDEGCGLYSYEGRMIVPTKYSCIITGRKIVYAIKTDVRPREDKYEIFGDEPIGLNLYYCNSIYGAYSYDGEHIIEDKFHKLEELECGIKAWLDEENYKVFYYNGKEV